MDKQTLLRTAAEETRAILQMVDQTFAPNPEQLLNRRPRPGKWSVLENFAHLNLACRIYYDEMAAKINTRPNGDLHQVATSGPIGKLSIRSIKPLPDGTIPRPMPTVPWFKPKHQQSGEASNLDKDQVLQQFRQDQQQLLQLLEQAEAADINRTRIVSSLGPLIQFRLGDAIRFLVGHNQRHMIQAQKALDVVLG